MLFWRQFFRMDKAGEGGGSGGGTPIVALIEPDLSTADGLKVATKSISDKLNEVIARAAGRPVGRAELDPVLKQMADFSTKLDNVDKIVKAGNRFNLGTEEGIARMSMLLNVPDDVSGCDRTYFNLAVLDPEELVGAAHLGRRVFSDLPQGIELWARDGIKARTMDMLREFQHLNDELLIVSEILWANGRSAWSRGFPNKWDAIRSMKRFKDFERIGTELNKAINEGTGNQGLNWVPVVLSADMMGLVQAQLRVAALFPQITMTSKTLDNPVLGGDLTAYLQAENTADTGQTAITASQPTFNKVTFTSQKLAVRTLASSESLEDIIIPMVPFIMSNSAKVIARGIEDGDVNGDTNASMDGATYNPAGGVKRAWNGLRQQCFDSTSNPATQSASNGNLTRAMSLTVLAKQKVFGATPSEGAWVAGFLAWAHLLNSPDMVTLEKYGAGATIMTGEVGRYFGRPVILSEFITDNYNASGVYDGTTTDRGELLHCYRSAYGQAQRRAVTIASSSERYIEFDQTVFVTTYRGDFEPFFPASATVAPVGAVYNLAAAIS